MYLKKPLKELYTIAQQESQLKLNQMGNKVQKKEVNSKERAFPSRLSQAGICFLSSSKENKILASESNKELIKFIYTILEEGSFKESNSSRESFDYLFKKYHIDNISKDCYLNISYY